MKIFISLLLYCSSIASFAQFNVRLNVSASGLKHFEDSIHVAGNFNGWNPASKQVFILNNSGEGFVELHLDKGNYEYKFTRGSWAKGETDTSGTGLPNRQLTIDSDTSFNLIIRGWQDDFLSAVKERKSTSSRQVIIMDTAFNMPQLHRARRIWLYLPKDYNSSSKKYPVLYMHDGQNLFDNATSGYGEWGVDECLDSLKNLNQCIVVGVDNGQLKRMNEYNPYAFDEFGAGEGSAYADFLVNTLKPYIDGHYKTKPGKKNTFIAGSSMGGLISLYIVLKYPETFGGAGIFSPAFWTASGIDKDVIELSKRMRSKLFFYAGGKEGDKMIPDMKRVEALIEQHSSSKIIEEIDVDASHNEAAWQKHFPSFYKAVIDKR